jgi:hypothetical protein
MTNLMLWFQAPVRKGVTESNGLSQEFRRWTDVCCSGKVVYERYEKTDNDWTYKIFGLFFEYEDDVTSYLLTWTEEFNHPSEIMK